MSPAAEFPKIIYGTAWKEELTGPLVQEAVKQGFRAFDTANQKKHYREDFAGEALAKTSVKRTEFFFQSKYTYPAGQDDRMPYDPTESFTRQVQNSFENSLRNFGTDYLDAYLLHGPSHPYQITAADLEVWRVFERLYGEGRVKKIGVSNVALHHLEALCSQTRVPPQIVQNRCYAQLGWDEDVRLYCRERDITYEGFSLLTANPRIVRSSAVSAIAARHRVTPEQIVLRFASQIDIVPLTGTNDPVHMRADLDIFRFRLSSSELESIQNLSV